MKNNKRQPIIVKLCSNHDPTGVLSTYEVGDLTDWAQLDLGTIYLEPLELRLAKVKSGFQLGTRMDVQVKLSAEDLAILKNMEMKISEWEKPVVFPLRQLPS
ncbi:MAG TPA: hypothetical protein V6D50_22920 [Chroococcales cyanobacterium]|jgi:hypothetical protein